ncbi:MAG: Y-family DNA polymerase [Muribaculaceae bacterium]|nr:Y-family DNA polymerase [Muribaculaceae bacterium]
MVGLADCNNFFVSCERTLDPSLEGRAVVVLSNNDGCVVARSNEAKRLGIRMGQPAFQIRDLLVSGECIALSGNHLLYREISIRIHDILRRYTPSTQDYSVDEAFLDMTGFPLESLQMIGEQMRKACWEEEHIPVTIGFAPTKTLAKLATESGKKSGRSVVVFADAADASELMASLPIRELWGVGRRLAKRLYQKGVYTIADFAAKDRMWVNSLMGIVGERSWCELHGQPCIEQSHLERPMQDSISETRTFPIDVDDFDYLRSRIVMYCSHVARRLRVMDGVSGEITVFMSSNRFHTERGYVSPSMSAVLNPPTDDTAAIVAAGVSLAETIYDPHYAYKRAGVILSKIAPRKVQAPTLFEEIEQERLANERSHKLMQAIDKVNQGKSKMVVKLATELSKIHPGHNDGYSSSFGPAKPL